MGDSILGRDMYRKLANRTWVLRKISRHYHHGAGPLFAFSLDIRPAGTIGLFSSYWIYICNDLSSPGGRIQITSNHHQSFTCGLERIRTMGMSGNKGYITVIDALLGDGSRHDFTIEIKLAAENHEAGFSELINFFGY